MHKGESILRAEAATDPLFAAATIALRSPGCYAVERLTFGIGFRASLRSGTSSAWLSTLQILPSEEEDRSGYLLVGGGEPDLGPSAQGTLLVVSKDRLVTIGRVGLPVESFGDALARCTRWCPHHEHLAMLGSFVLDNF